MEADNGLREQVRVLQNETGRMRDRSHIHGNKLAEHDAEIEAIGRTLQRLDITIHELDGKMENRFNRLSTQAWRIGGLLLGAMTLAATVVSVVLQ